MRTSQRFIREPITPHYTTLVLFMAAAVALAAGPGYRLGDNYVKDQYVLDDPFAAMFGGYPAAVVVFGLVLQLGVDLMRLPAAQRFDQNVLGSVDRAVARALGQRCQRASAVVNQALLTPGEGTLVETTAQGAKWLELAKRVALRLATYGQVAATGMSASLMPITLMYAGEDIFSPETDLTCRVGASAVALLQVSSMFAAYRMEPPRIAMRADSEALASSSPDNR